MPKRRKPIIGRHSYSVWKMARFRKRHSVNVQSWREKFVKDIKDIQMSVLVQYVLVRGDLIKTLNWPVGAVIAQACHAATAAIHMFYNDPSTQLYLQDLDNMHKIILEVPDEEALKKVAETLSENAISHKLWIEQPENIATCLAVKPFPKEDVQKYFKKFKLMKG